MKLNAHLDTVPRIRMEGAIPPLPLVPLPICTSFDSNEEASFRKRQKTKEGTNKYCGKQNLVWNFSFESI